MPNNNENESTTEQLMNEAVDDFSKLAEPVPRTTNRIAALAFPIPLLYECIVNGISREAIVIGIGEGLALSLVAVFGYAIWIVPKGILAYRKAEKYRKAFYREGMKKLTGKDIDGP